jgi:hypothetical protein
MRSIAKTDHQKSRLIHFAPFMFVVVTREVVEIKIG